MPQFTIKYVSPSELRIELDQAFGSLRHPTYRELEERLEEIEGVESAHLQRYSGQVFTAPHAVPLRAVAVEVYLVLREYGEVVEADINLIGRMAEEQSR